MCTTVPPMPVSTTARSTSDRHTAPDPHGLPARSLLDGEDALRLAETFSLLSSDTRLRLLHAISRAGEICVKNLAAEVSMSPSAVCNQLVRLVDRRIIVSRRDGNFMYYRVEDPCLLQMIELGACLTLDGPGGRCHS